MGDGRREAVPLSYPSKFDVREKGEDRTVVEMRGGVTRSV